MLAEACFLDCMGWELVEPWDPVFFNQRHDICTVMKLIGGKNVTCQLALANLAFFFLHIIWLIIQEVLGDHCIGTFHFSHV